MGKPLGNLSVKSQETRSSNNISLHRSVSSQLFHPLGGIVLFRLVLVRPTRLRLQNFVRGLTLISSNFQLLDNRRVSTVTYPPDVKTATRRVCSQTTRRNSNARESH